MAETDTRQCIALTRKGTQCRNPALPNSDYCRMHAAMVAAGNPPATLNDAPPAEEAATTLDAPAPVDAADPITEAVPIPTDEIAPADAPVEPVPAPAEEAAITLDAPAPVDAADPITEAVPIPTDEIAPADAPVEPADTPPAEEAAITLDAPAPVDAAAPAEEAAITLDAPAPVDEPATAEEADDMPAPVDTAAITEAVPIPTDEIAPADAPAEPVPAPAEEAAITLDAPADVAAPVEEAAITLDAPAPAEEAATTLDAPPAEEAIPVLNMAAPAKQPQRSSELTMPASDATGTPSVASTTAALHKWADELTARTSDMDNAPAAATTLAAEMLRLMAATLEYSATPAASAAAMRLLQQTGTTTAAMVNPAFWREISVALGSTLLAQMNMLERRSTGNYAVDEFGLDEDLLAVWLPFFTFLYRDWWRIQTDGMEHVPSAGRALLVANHSGVLPWDGVMLTTAIYLDHPEQPGRVARNLVLDWFGQLPVLAPIFAAMGAVPANPDNARLLLNADKLVSTFPEGSRGIGKPFQQRYQLERFGRGGAVQVALQTGAPIIPVAIVGAEETYPMLGNFAPLAKLFGLPYFPVSLFFPWLGVFGVVPLPTRWRIIFCPPVEMASYGAAAADDPLLVAELTEQLRTTIQDTLNAALAERASWFLG